MMLSLPCDGGVASVTKRGEARNATSFLRGDAVVASPAPITSLLIAVGPALTVQPLRIVAARRATSAP